MKITIHRGATEIGGSSVEIQSGTSRIVIDIGMPLTLNGKKFDFNKYKDHSGPQLVAGKILPDIKGLYEWDETNQQPAAVLISHPHIDHYGFLGQLHPLNNVFMGAAAQNLMELTVMFSPIKGWDVRCHNFINGHAFNVGDFIITPFLMDHSGFDSYGFSIEAAGKKIFYSGDFRGTGRKAKAFKWLLYNGPRDIDALILEGTMMGGRQTEKIKNENDIETEAVAAIKRSNGITFLQASSQNIDRIVSFYRAAVRTDKIFVIDIYTAIILDTLKNYAQIPYPSPHYKNLRVFYAPHICKSLELMERKDLIYKFKNQKMSVKELAANQDKIVLMIRTSLLKYLKSLGKKHKGIFIYSLWEGYLKEKGSEQLLKYIADNEMEFVQIHTSGHAGINDLKKLVDKFNPRTVIPIHTTNPENYKILSDSITVIKDGETLNI